ncbi:MAG: hypothetical protein IPP88_07710 [Betaproteobacteria bacterium]|nr:hypothetical protein [Betaproteobacteria bacterium]
MAHWELRARNTTLFFCALLLNGKGVCDVHAQVPALVYKTQVYGHGYTDSLPGSGDANLAKNSMAMDAAGNIYVTGSTSNGLNTDFLTVKYGATDGAILWRTVTNGAANGDDLAYAITLDNAGNVLVTGSSQAGGQNDYLTVKYNNNGEEIWRATLDGAAHRDDEAYAIGTDAAGNVFVTGASAVGATGYNYDYLTVKYDSSGTFQWSEPLDGAGAGIDRSVALCLDSTGNAVVTGYSFNGLNFDYVTAKYSTNSQLLWRKSMNNGGANSNDVAYAMACDAAGNVYVTGKSGDGSAANYLTIKYNSNGIEQWPAPVVTNGNGGAADTSFAIAVDIGGNVIVTGRGDQDYGTAPSVTNPLHLTAKYNASGVLLWTATLNGSGTGVDSYSALTTDGAGNIYTTGFASKPANGPNELVVVKYAPAGNAGAGVVLWQKFIDGVGSANGAALLAIRVDTFGNVIVTGYESNGVENHFLVVKFDAAGTELWRRNEGEHTGLTSTLASGAPGRNALAVDSAGSVYVAGQNGPSSSSDFITTKFDVNGLEQWRAELNGNPGGVDRGYAVAIDGNGNVYAAGDSFAGGHSDFMLVKYNAVGTELWRMQPGNSGNALNNSVRALAVDPAGDVIVTGSTSAGDDFLTIKYSANGFEQWRKTANSAGNSIDSPVAMAIDATGNTVVTGRSFDGVNEGYLTVKYAADSTLLWQTPLPGNSEVPRQPHAIAIDSTGNVFVAGDTLVKYNASGNEQWHTPYTFRAYAMALAPGGAIVVGGAGGLVVKYDGDGNEIWRHAINGSVNGNEIVHTLAVDADGGIYTSSRDNADLNGDYVTIKLGPDGNERWRLTTPTGGGGAIGSPALVLDATRNVILAGNAVAGSLPAAIMVTKFSQAPPAPTGVTAIAGNAMASVSFTPPAVTEAPISAYIVSCQPGAIQAGGLTSPIIVTGLMNDQTYACSVKAISVFGSSQPSASANVTPSASAPLALFAVKSKKTHGAADYSLNVELSPVPSNAVTVEPRAIGTGHTLVFQFSNAITTIGSTSANIGSAAAIPSGSDVVVTLTGVPDNERVQVSFTDVMCVTCIGGSTIASTGATLGFLLGDVNSSRSVNAADISAVKAHVGQSTGAANFRFDFNASGGITAMDLSAVKARSGLVLP